MQKVYGYIRTDERGSVPNSSTQKKWIESYCRQHKLVLDEIFTDENASGESIERDGLLRLLEALESGTKVVVFNTSCLWYGGLVRALITGVLKQAQADIISIKEPKASLDSRDWRNRDTETLLESLRTIEMLKLNKRLKNGRLKKAQAGHKASGVAPMGYAWSDGANIEVNMVEADTVGLIFHKYLELGSLGKLKNYLDNKSILTRRGNLFSKQALADILSNPFYIGAVTHGATKVQGAHKSIIEQEVFSSVQAQLIANRKR